MTELLSWLRATIEADNTAAEAATPGPWSYDPIREWYDGEDFVMAGELRRDQEEVACRLR